MPEMMTNPHTGDVSRHTEELTKEKSGHQGRPEFQDHDPDASQQQDTAPPPLEITDMEAQSFHFRLRFPMHEESQPGSQTDDHRRSHPEGQEGEPAPSNDYCITGQTGQHRTGSPESCQGISVTKQRTASQRVLLPEPGLDTEQPGCYPGKYPEIHNDKIGLNQSQ